MAFKGSAIYSQGLLALFILSFLIIHSMAQVPSTICTTNTQCADIGVCQDLVNPLRGNDKVIPDGQQYLCKKFGGNQCCVRWAVADPGVTETISTWQPPQFSANRRLMAWLLAQGFSSTMQGCKILSACPTPSSTWTTAKEFKMDE